MTVYDSTNPKHVAIQRRRAKVDDATRLEFIKHSMGMPNGRAYIYNLLVSCHVFADSLFTPDALAMSFSSGRHSVGQQIIAEIMAACPDDYVQMMREANARELADDTRRSRSDADSNRDDSGPEYVHPAYDGAAQVSGNGGTEGSGDYDPIEREAEGAGD